MSSSINSQQAQFLKFRSYLAHLLVEIAGASVEERLIISQRGEFIELINILKWARDQDRNIARPLQEWVCKAVELLIQKNKESAQIGFQDGIVTELQTLLSKDLKLEEVKYIHFNCLKLFTTYGDSEIKKNMFKMDIIQSIKHCLKSSCSKVVEKTLAIIYNIVRNANGLSEEPQKNPYLEQLQKDGIIIALYQNGIQNGGNETIRKNAAESIGQLYNHAAIPADMKEEVIKTLKNSVEIEVGDNDAFQLFFSLFALSCLAWNIDNHDEILKGNFVSMTQNILMIDDSNVHQNILNLMLIILKIGSQQSQEILKKDLPLPLIREFTKILKSQVKQFAFLLLSWVSRHEEMMKFEKLKKEIVWKSKNETTRLARDGLMEEIHSILREAKSNVEDNGGLILVVCDVAEVIFDLNVELMKQELSENRFIDLLFQFYEAVLPSQFMHQYGGHLTTFIPLVKIFDKLYLKKEKYINPLIRFLDCKAEIELSKILLSLVAILSPVNETGQIQQKDEIRSFMENNGALNHLIRIFLHYQFTNNIGKGCCAIAIGFLHKAMQIPDEFRGAVIEILKQIIENKEKINMIFPQESANALSKLAENCGNHTDIISGNFTTVLYKCISDTYLQTQDYGLILALNLLRFGSEDVQQKVKEGVPIERVRNLMTNRNDEIQLTAELLNQRITEIS
ncbi:MAG: hypothetical protein EZS28_007172 [Streblomastix strix]|uniref:Uncharacterized protein n=1 Tax=Streblomastix strix TaxID=222440 RepID=A0A5J4WQU9_9EUKA|nr:MAG: hypothetical protein EZS28_007172 [Streblomastix strix]